MRHARIPGGLPDGGRSTASRWVGLLTASAIAAVAAVVAIVVVGSARSDRGEATLVPVPAVAETPAPMAPTPRPTPEALRETGPAGRGGVEALALDATEVVLVGDSLAEGASAGLATILESAGVPLRVDARSGRGTAEGARALEAMAVAPGAVVVVILGTNDAEDREEAVRNVRAVAEAVPTGVPIRWIDVARRDADVVNEVLEAVAAMDPDLEVLAWSSVVADNPDMVVSDGIHFTAQGYATLAAFIAAEALGVPLPPT